jgi:dephospho-CoA kinase
MKVIGLTGNIASGKTTVLKIFKFLGYPTISCDDVYHDLLKTDTSLKNKLVRTFGREILDGNKISTQKLAKIICYNKQNLKKLEKITHPIILNKVFDKIKKLSNKGYKLCVIDVPLLFEKKLEHKFDYIITIYCSKQIQIERLKKRIVNKKLLNLLIERQKCIKEKIQKSDFVINNDDASKKEIQKQVEKIINFL